MYYLQLQKVHTMAFADAQELADFLYVTKRQVENACRRRGNIHGLSVWSDGLGKEATILAIEDGKSIPLTIEGACERYLLSEEKLDELLATGRATRAGVTFDVLVEDQPRLKKNSNRNWQKALTIDGETRSVNEWAEIAKVSADAIYWRIRQGWAPKDAVFRPNQKHRTGKRKPQK